MNEVALAKALIAARIEKAEKKAVAPTKNGTSGKADSGVLSLSLLPSASRVLLDPGRLRQAPLSSTRSPRALVKAVREELGERSPCRRH